MRQQVFDTDKGTFPGLESLISECTGAARLPEPDAIFIVPDAMAFAYSRGRFASRTGPRSLSWIGAPLLFVLRPG